MWSIKLTLCFANIFEVRRRMHTCMFFSGVRTIAFKVSRISQSINYDWKLFPIWQRIFQAILQKAVGNTLCTCTFRIFIIGYMYVHPNESSVQSQGEISVSLSQCFSALQGRFMWSGTHSWFGGWRMPLRGGLPRNNRMAQPWTPLGMGLCVVGSPLWPHGFWVCWGAICVTGNKRNKALLRFFRHSMHSGVTTAS